MRIGITLPHLGAQITPAALATAARRAEELEYDNLWVIERLLRPTDPRSPYPVTADGSLPKYYDHVLTPLETLSYAAAHTTRIGLGTGVLVMPLHNPIVLARELATIDFLSGGRLRLGLGQGWSLDEIEAAGGTFGGRAARADEFVQVLKTIWTSEVAEHHGPSFTLPRSVFNPKPVQQPHPPIYMAAYAPSALNRVGRLADGWMPAGVPLAATWQLMGQVREAALAAGRDPNTLELVMFADGTILDRSPGADRQDFVGTLDEIARDVATARDLGATELIFMPGYGTGDLDLEAYMRGMEQLRPLVREPAGARP